MTHSTDQKPNWFRRFIMPPAYADAEQARVARLLHAILLVVWVILILAVTSTPLIGEASTVNLLVIGGAAIFQTIIAYLNRHGQVRLASGIYLVFLWMATTAVVALIGGVSSPTANFMLLPIITGSLLLGASGTALTSILTLISTTLILIVGQAGLLPPSPIEPTPIQYWVDITLSVLMAGGLLVLAVNSIQEALTAARRSVAAQTDSNRELAAIHTSLEARVAERTSQLNASAEIARAVLSILDPDGRLQRVTQLIVERFNLYYAAAFLVDGDAKFAVLREATGEAGRVLKERGHQLEIAGPSLVGLAITTRQPRSAQDTGADAARFAGPLLTETRSEVAVPLIVGDRVIGALDIYATHPDTFDAGLIGVLQGLADQIAIAVDNARQYQIAQIDAQQATLLYETSQATSFIGESPTSAVNRLFGVVATRSDFDAWTATRFDADNRAYTVLTAFDANEPAPLEEVDQVFRIDQAHDTPTSLAIRTGRPVIINDPATDPRVARMSPAMVQSIGKSICVPALASDRILGTISLGRTSDKPDMGPRDIQLAQALANQLAVSLENRRLFAESQAAIAELNQLMALYTRQGWSQFSQLRQGAGLQQEYSQSTAKPLDPKFLPQIEQAIRARQAQPITHDGQSVVGVPITLRGEVLGTLAIQDNQDRRWTEDELATVRAVADQVAQSIEAARLLENSEASLQETTTLYEVSRALSTAPSLTEALSLLVKTIYHRLHADQAALVLFDEARGYGTIVAEAVPSPDAPTKRLPMQGNPSYEVLNETKRSISISDIDHHPVTANIIDLLQSRHVKSMLIIPVLVGTKLIGSFGVDSRSQRNFSEQEIAFCETLARQTAGTIDRYQLFEQTQTSLEETTTLYEVTRALSTAPSLTEALNLLVQTIHRRLKADQTALVLFDEARGYGTIVAEAVPSSDGIALRLPMQGNSSYEILAETKRSISIYDIEHHPATANIIDLLKARHVKSMLIVPLLLGPKLIGSFGVDSQTPRNFSEQEIAFFETLARQAAGTIERYQLFEQTQASLEETTALYQASRDLMAAQTPAAVLQGITASINAPQIDRAVLTLIDPASPREAPVAEVVAAWERHNDQPTGIGDRWDMAKLPLIGQQISEPRAIDDVAASSGLDPLSRHVFLEVLGIKAVAIIPMYVGGRQFGWLLIESQQSPYHFTDQELRRFRTLADQATIALENRRLFQNAEARVGELTVLTRIGRRLASTLELDEVLSLIVEESINATEARQASISLYNEAENALEVRVMRGYAPEMERATLGTLIRPGQGLHGRLLTTGRAVLVADVQDDADYRAAYGSDTRSEFIVPIRQGELLLGALNLESPKPRAFADTDVRLIEALADQVAIAITNARAYEAERQAVERTREADRLKTEFLANMSHELRTPLNSIIGFSRVILRGIDGPISELQQTDLAVIYSSGQHLLSLINNVLDLSKIEAGKMELLIEPLDLRDIAKSVMSTAIALVKDKSVRLEQDVPDELPTVMADQTRVRQIMLNLVSNAAKFTETGAITLRVTPYPNEVHVSVTDTGIGVANDKLEHIFEEFTQADASTTRRYGGTGLGLAITKKFVDMHKGRIWATSQVGAGSTFTFTLPREQAIEEPAPAISLPTDLEARGEGKKLVMCIDDDPGVITLYKRYLEKQGYQVIGLTDSTKAVEEARRLLPFAITLDVLMPHRDGWDVLADLKKTPEIANTPIVLCSIIHDTTKGYTLGAADYLVKPITEGELLGALDRVRHTMTVRRVLIVDDEPDAIDLLKRLLEATPGYEVITAAGGAEALAAVQAGKPDLLILDLMMPDIDGFAVLDTIKSSVLTRHIPVIIVTAKDLTVDDRARLQGKTVALFNKGMFTADQLLTDIVGALQAMNGANVTALAA